uniref:P2X purinoceptor n=1 Tax=Salmo trutta TaxID=8032 RepID=A0A674BCV8_SALTR
MLWRFITDFFTYETTKSVVVKSWSVGIINRVVQLLIIIYFVCWVFLHEKAYQVKDSGIESSVMTKVKGFGYHNNRVMDVADYVAPTQGAAVFCIITKLIVTEQQFQGLCPEVSPFQSRIITGACVNSSEGGRCEMEGWCPAENDKVIMQPMMEVENFTIFIKNSIRFPMFNVTRGNFPSSLNTTYIRSCTYDPEHNRHCPIFKVGDVLRYTGQNFSTIAQTGGEIGINIEWECNLDESEERCEPHYSFTRLDAVFQKNAISQGYNFRFAKYYKTENGMENRTDFRTLHKAYAIRFDILVTGLAGKFNTVPTLINLVAAFTSVGLGTVLCDIILLNFLKGADQYKAKKFEEVSESQIQILLSQESCSQLSIKPEEKISDDSGAVSLCLDQQL